MKIITTNIHGILDYAVALLIIALPFLLNFPAGSAEKWVLIGSGIATISYSLVTQYEHSIADVIPFSFHLILDISSAILLATSP
ncbi:hypothetical protein [Pseudochryseolinea flava]|uniref:Uncharacterized protein n=1 Tax=Pseudochryseolinea flava TaxID=2059302 RepID=A0A364Y2J3_9BACT|nr:hypothetical protein [Pseudochryseolinea flava]RAW00180.1 hypothetical protein DQQ10_16675 [Pseudochryseolinea flava]